METPTLRYRDLMVILVDENRILWDLFKGEEKYESLLNELMRYDTEDEDPLPAQKDLLKTLNLSRRQLMDLMQGLYHDFKMELIKPHTYQISDTQIFLRVETRDKIYTTIGVKDLKFISRVGDTFQIYFAKSEWSMGYFHVEEVSHEIQNGAHTINIYMNDKFERTSSLKPEAILKLIMEINGNTLNRYLIGPHCLRNA